jgi:D-glycero-D-manno-heptose 1,7-bisphosphate phosphatase
MGIDEVSHRAVFLDRDGVIDRAVVRDGKPYPPSSMEELEILPGVGDALASLRDNGFKLIVVTNQPDVARGTQSREVVEAMHKWLCEQLPLDAIYACYHDNSDQCNCRKPAPGLLLHASDEYDIDLTASFMVGDRWRDIEAGKRAGCKTLFIDYGYDEQLSSEPDVVISSLMDAANWILRFVTDD